MPLKSYRRDIEGLRAIAVIAVVLFHLGVIGFSGGYVGVDIFFVISGYLITGNILADRDAGTFKFSRFYTRRVRRLFPALFVTTLVAFCVGFATFDGSLFKDLSRTVVATILSVSNILFWTDAGYFDADADLKPLLHTWSLSVEEQFYVVWPAILVAAGTLKKNWSTPAVLIGLGTMSLVAAEWYVLIDASAAFFLTPLRVCEFVIGAFCVYAQRLQPRINFTLHQVMSLCGMGLMLWAVFTYTKDTPFPGLHALIPCLGAALVILSSQSLLARRVLSHFIFVGTGKISYSLYLVHWPLIVFYSHAQLTPLTNADKGLLLGATFALGLLLYRYIEMPFRHTTSQPRLARPAIFSGAFAASLILLVGPATHAALHQGWPWRPASATAGSLEASFEAWSQSRLRLFQWKKEGSKFEGRPCKLTGEGCRNTDDLWRVLVIGDSHGLDAANAIQWAYPNARISMSSAVGCPPLAPQDWSIIKPAHPMYAPCTALNGERQSAAHVDGYDTIVINVLWAWYTPAHLSRYLKVAKSLTDARIVVLGNFAVLNRACSVVAAKDGLQACSDPKNVASLGLYEEELSNVALDAGVTYVSKVNAFCPGDALANCLTVSDGVPFTADKHHLTAPFAKRLGAYLKTNFDAALRPPPA